MSKPSIGRPVRKSTKSSGKGWISILLLIALGGGGYYGYNFWQELEMERRGEEAARNAGLNADKRLAEEMARLAAEKEEQDRLAEEEEQRRLKAEEEEALRKKKEAEKTSDAQKTEEGTSKDTPPAPDAEPAIPQINGEPSIYDKAPPLHGANTNDSSRRKAFNKLLDNLLEKHDFDVFERAMSAKVQAAMKEYTANGRLTYGHYKNRPNLVLTVELCYLIRSCGAATVAEIAAMKGNGIDTRGIDFFEWLLRDKSRPLHVFMQNFAYQRALPGNMAHALKQLYTIWAETDEEEDRSKYANLAIAASLITPDISNAPSSYRNEDDRILTISEVCAYLRENDSKGKLVTNLKELTVSQLIHVVDVRLPEGEFYWAANETTYSQEGWSEAYSSVDLLMDRVANDTDPYKVYSFEEIKEEGGSCYDRAYFACNTAKCRGVPAVCIKGDGEQGPHAWMVHLADKDTWKQSHAKEYNSGHFINPCSGQSQHESMLTNSDSKTRDDSLTADAMLLADYLISAGYPREAQNVAAFIAATYQLDLAAWAHYVHILGHDTNHLPAESVWRKIVADLTKLSKKNYELLGLASEVEDKYLLAGRSASNKQKAAQRAMSQLIKNGGEERTDLLLAAINRQASAMMETNNYSGMAAFYRKLYKQHTGNIDLFSKLMQQNMEHLGTEASPRVWHLLARDTEKLFKRNIKTGSEEFFRLRKEVEIQNMIADAWAKTGDERKAAEHRSEAEERLNKIKERIKEEAEEKAEKEDKEDK